MASNKDYSNHIVGGTILIIVILVGIFFATQNRSTSAVVGQEPNEEAGSTSGTLGTLAAADQAAGESVAVTGMSVTSDSWIAVREADGSRVLGAARVAAGTESVTVPLLRATAAGTGYEVVIYTDDGDRAFDMKKDMLVSGVRAAFDAQ